MNFKTEFEKKVNEAKPSSLDFDDELWKKFRVKCLQQGKSASEVLREFVEKYVKT